MRDVFLQEHFSDIAVGPAATPEIEKARGPGHA
jgi:hypothetical protein